VLEVVGLRVAIFLIALFGLRGVLRLLSVRRSLPVVLVLLGLSSLIAFVATAALLAEPAASALVEWVVIYGLIAVIFVARRSAGPVRPLPPER
jgi:hypothetical protein